MCSSQSRGLKGKGNKMGFLDGLKRAGILAGQLGGAAGVPGLALLDDAIEQVEKSKATKAETAAITAVLQATQIATAIAPVAVSKKPLESKKFWGLLVGLGTTLLVTQLGLDEAMTAQALESIVWLVGSLVGAQGLQDAAKAVRGG